MSQKKWVADVRFIFGECARIQTLLKTTKLKDISRDDLSTFPTDRGPTLCGRAALLRLHQLIQAAADRDDPHGTCDRQEIGQNLSRVMWRRFVGESKPINEKEVQRSFSEAVRAAKKSRKDRTHYIPCRLMYEEARNQFRIGAVSFMSLPVFKEAIAPHFNKYQQDASGDWKAITQRRVKRARQYYQAFTWVASATVRNCAPEPSRRRARIAVSTAVNVLHIVFGSYHTRRMTVGGPRRENDHRSHLCIAEGDRLELLSSSSATSAVGFTKGWEGLLARDDIAPLLAAAEKIIEPILDTSINRPLATRIADAADWFGQAVREENDASSIVKAMTALERLFITERDKNNVAATLAKRAAAMSFDPDSSESLDDMERRLGAAYDLRSRLVHGGLSPLAAEVQIKRNQVLGLVENVLCFALARFDVHDGIGMVKTDKGLASGLGQIVKWAARLEAMRTK